MGPISQMSPQIQAGFEALKGKFYLWCCTDSEYAFKHILGASKLDPDFAPWQYWTGKILSMNFFWYSKLVYNLYQSFQYTIIKLFFNLI